MNLDKELAEKIYQATKKSPVFSRLAIFGARRLIWILVGLVLISSSPLTPPPHSGQGEGEVGGDWERFLVVAIGVIVAWAIQLIVAFTIHRRRPFQQNHEKPLMKLLFQTPSFPSGHTTISCALAASVFVFDPIIGTIFFAVAALVALSRVAIGVHYFSDILGGAVVGIGAVVIVSRLIV
ncbi:MAG: phosphatase PAP2 family protein [Candidatus Uhrbacteria bacterium]